MLLWKCLLDELGERCCTSTSLDYKKAEIRFEHEGFSFFTITLPNFGKDLEKGLEQGMVDRSLFAGFQWRAGLPLFLGGFLDHVFDRGTGRLLENPSVDSILAIRQLTLFYGKILLDCSEERQEGAIRKFLECESEVRKADQNTSPGALLELQGMSALLFRDVFTKMDSDVYNGFIMGKHGPGKTADHLEGNSKYDLSYWPERLEAEFPYWEHGIPSPSEFFLARYSRVSLCEPGTELPVKVVLVPKTLKTPRVIAIEPTAVQYMQQGIMEKLVDYLERDHLVQSMIGFSRQEPNQLLAAKGSRDGLLATLDLSEASDRVSNQHVRVMLQRFPSFFRAVDATRSRKADVPGKGVVRLAKFASMGSALCFPFEAMVFLSMVFLGIQDGHKRQLTRKDIASFAGQVRVYGDDIIVPVRYVPFVMQRLESFGIKVNANKSFWNGKFRESCGKDYYDGHDVSIIRARREIPSSRTDVQEILSTVSLRNQLYFAGLWRTARYLDRILEPILVHYPVLDPDMQAIAFTGKPSTGSPLLGRQSFCHSFGSVRKLDANYQNPIDKGWVVVAKPPISPISGEGALLKWFLKRGEQPFADRDHLERQGRPKSVNIKLRWKATF